MDPHLSPLAQTLALIALGLAGGVMFARWSMHATRPASTADTLPRLPHGEHIWERAALEWSSPDRRHGIWAQCFVTAGGDAPRAMALYLRVRADQLREELAAAGEPGRTPATLAPPRGALDPLAALVMTEAPGWALIAAGAASLVALVSVFGIATS